MHYYKTNCYCKDNCKQVTDIIFNKSDPFLSSVKSFEIIKLPVERLIYERSAKETKTALILNPNFGHIIFKVR